jgi:hypothetical protein
VILKCRKGFQDLPAEVTFAYGISVLGFFTGTEMRLVPLRKFLPER